MECLLQPSRVDRRGDTRALAILGLGTAVPPHRVMQAEAAEWTQGVSCRTVDQVRLQSVLYRRAGIRSRHVAVFEAADGQLRSLPFFPPAASEADRGPTTARRMERYDLEARALACRAARQALERSEHSAGDITHLVTVSCTGFAAPGVDIALLKDLGLERTVQRVHVGFMGCHGALNGLQVAAAITGTDPGARVLLCAVEVCSVHLRYGWDPDRVVANALFADGAAALICGTATAAAPEAPRLAATGSCLVPDSDDALTWRIGDHGFEMTLSARLPGLIRKHLRPWLEEWLGRNRLRPEQVGSWAVHPGGPRVLNAVEEALGLGADALAVSREVLSAYGNMSSPTVLFTLDHLCRRRAPRPYVAMGFGPGLAVEAAIFV